MDSPHLGFAVCYCKWLGTGSEEGLQLFYAIDEQTIGEVDWISGSNTWNKRDQFPANGHTGIGSYTWDTVGTVIYLMVGTLDNDLTIIWKDMNASAPTWTNSSVLIPGISPISDISYNKVLMQQMNNGSLSGRNITFDAENTKLVDGSWFELPQKPLPGTHIWVWEFNVSAVPPELTVFNQINGTDITATVKLLGSHFELGNVSSSALQIPDS